MSSAELAVVIGATQKERIAAQVCAHTVLEHATCSVRIIHTYGRAFDCPPGATGFSYLRFAAPELVDRKGIVLYLDSDMLVYGDVKELLDTPMKGFHVLCPSNQAAVMLIDAATAPFSLESVCTVPIKRPGHAPVGLMQLREGLSGARVGRTLSESWNVLDRVTSDMKLLHYTNMRTQPWLASRPFRHPHADHWFKALKSAFEAGEINYDQLVEDVEDKILHRECLEAVE